MTQRVILNDTTDYNTRPGTHWIAHKLSDGTYSLMAQNSQQYLDSWPSKSKLEETVFLSNTIDGRAGTRWIPQRLGDGTYALKSNAAKPGEKCFLDTWPAEEMVFLSETTDPVKRRGTHLMVGVDWYTGREVEDIVRSKYPGMQIKFYKTDAKYGQMEYETLKRIWSKSGLGHYNWQREKFDCDDFAVCFKAEVAKYCYSERVPFDAACLCGIIFATNNNDKHVVRAFNFTVDAFGDLILFEPQLGAKIPFGEWTPYFCMM